MFKIHKTTRSIVEFEYIDPSGGSETEANYNWLYTHLLKDRKTRESNKILWTLTNTDCSFTIIKDGRLLKYHNTAPFLN